jgi:hypothetical protein
MTQDDAKLVADLNALKSGDTVYIACEWRGRGRVYSTVLVNNGKRVTKLNPLNATVHPRALLLGSTNAALRAERDALQARANATLKIVDEWFCVLSATCECIAAGRPYDAEPAERHHVESLAEIRLALLPPVEQEPTTQAVSTGEVIQSEVYLDNESSLKSFEPELRCGYTDPVTGEGCNRPKLANDNRHAGCVMPSKHNMIICHDFVAPQPVPEPAKPGTASITNSEIESVAKGRYYSENTPNAYRAHEREAFERGARWALRAIGIEVAPDA